MADGNVGPWAADKLDRLRKYLNAYTKIMKEQSKWCKAFYYIDAFAGPGQHIVRAARSASKATNQQYLLDVSCFAQHEAEHQAILDGSPRVALDIEHPFSGYVFVDKNASRVAALESIKKESKGRRKIVIRKADCNRYLQDKVVNNREIDWVTNRAVVFLDPFVMQVPWSTVESLGRTGAIEVFLNFPVGMAIQRLIPRDPDKVTDQRRAMLNEYFGSPEWYDVVYRSRARPLFGLDEDEKIEQSGKRLVEWYRGRLKEAFGFVSKAALIRNTRRGHLYYLMLASPKANGVKIADHILSAGETI